MRVPWATVWGTLLAVLCVWLLVQAVPVPVTVQASRLHRQQAAPYCEGRTARGYPCNRRTVHPSGRCHSHRALERILVRDRT